MLAACVGIAGWAGLLALRREAQPEQPLPPIAPIVPPPLPQRLPPAPDFARVALPAAASRDHGVRAVEVRIPHLPAPVQTLSEAGVATFDGRTGADFTWLPLTGGTTNADGSTTLRSATRVRGDLVVTLATARAWARHSYLARTTVDTAAVAAGAPLAIELPVAAETVRVSLPPAKLGTGPLRLSRRDDAQWLPAFHTATGITVLPGMPTELLLGAGTYELLDPVDATRSLRFVVPGTDTIVLTEALTRARADRP